jgi:hypothetical protein
MHYTAAVAAMCVLCSLLQASMHSSGPGLHAAFFTGLPADLRQQLQPGHVIDLLQAALASEQQQGAGQRVQAIYQLLPAARVLDTDSAYSLLEAAVQHLDAAAAAALCGLAGAQQIDEQSISSLLAGALASGGYQKVEALVCLAAARRLTADALLPIAVAAVSSSERELLPVLLHLPAAAGMSGADMDMLLHAAVDAVGESGQACAMHVGALCGLCAAATAGSEALVAALHAAVDSCSSNCCHWADAAVANVCELLAKQQRDVPAAQLAALLQVAHSKRMSRCVWKLLDLPQVLQLQEPIVADCLQQVLQDRPWRWLGILVSAVAIEVLAGAVRTQIIVSLHAHC